MILISILLTCIYSGIFVCLLCVSLCVCVCGCAMANKTSSCNTSVNFDQMLQALCNPTRPPSSYAGSEYDLQTNTE